MKIYTIKDVVAEEISNLMLLKNDACACRVYKNALKNENARSEDFELLCLGEINTETGIIVPRLSRVEMTDVEPDGKPVVVDNGGQKELFK